MNSFFRSLSLVLATTALSACASVIDTPNQQLRIMTPGAEKARCVVATQFARYIAYPPKDVFIRRMQEPLTIICQAPGNREKTVVVYARLNKSAVGNVITGGVTAAYDHASGALYEYPSPVIVDFSNVRASTRALPAYHNPDTVSPFDHVNEPMTRGTLQTTSEQRAAKTDKVSESAAKAISPNLKEMSNDIERPY
jgi:hypothetical protein